MSLNVVNEFNLHLLKRLLADWPESELDWQPQDELHSARWLLTHLAIAVDYGLMQFDLKGVCPAAWHQAYGPGSRPGSAENRPEIAELLSVIEEGYAQLRSLASQLDTAPLREAHSVPLLAKTPLKTRGDLATHILSTHFAFHVGQLSMLRRMLGRPPLF
jgi:uncharacterized damage-inducible protein DinB